MNPRAGALHAPGTARFAARDDETNLSIAAAEAELRRAGGSASETSDASPRHSSRWVYGFTVVTCWVSLFVTVTKAQYRVEASIGSISILTRSREAIIGND